MDIILAAVSGVVVYVLWRWRKAKERKERERRAAQRWEGLFALLALAAGATATYALSREREVSYETPDELCVDDILFTQPSIDAHIDPRKRQTGQQPLQNAVDELFHHQDVEKFPTIRVVKHHGRYYSLDNHRLFIFKLLWSRKSMPEAGKVPVEVLSLEDDGVKTEFDNKFQTKEPSHINVKQKRHDFRDEPLGSEMWWSKW